MAVTWVGGTALVESTGTSLAANAPSGLANGDNLWAAVYARSAITPPSGWTLVAQTGNFTDGTITQNLAVYRKNSTTSGDASASFTWSQASSHPIGVVYAATRGGSSSPSTYTAVVDSGDTSLTGALLVSNPAGSLSASADGQMLLVFGSVTTADPAGGPGGVSAGSWSDISLDPAGRLIGVYGARNTGQGGPANIFLDLDDFSESSVIYGAGVVSLMVIEATAAVDAIITADGPLSLDARLLGEIPATVLINEDTGPLGTPSVLGWHDNSGAINSDGSARYLVDLVTPDGDVRVPISSWQATLQTEAAQYVQCVVPACGTYVDDIGAATSFRISRELTLNDATTLEYQICEAPLQAAQFAQGTTNYTATLSGYIDAAPVLTWPPSSARTLLGARTVFTYTSGLRVRCAIDWLLQPGMSATYQSTTFTVAFVQYFVNGTDAYMDVGQRLE